MTRLSIVAILSMLTAGCATTPAASRLNQLSIGMSRADVSQIMGEPHSISAKGDVEYLTYQLTPTSDVYYTYQYFVRMVKGKVESFGKAGDFDSTKDPSLNVNLNQR